jgi:hypothetical protein
MTYLKQSDRDWLEAEAHRIITGAIDTMDESGLQRLNPAIGGYIGMWLRDSEYAVESVPEVFEPAFLENILSRFIAHQRPDGALPVALTNQPEGPHYLCWGNPAMTDADTAQFAVKMACDHYRNSGEPTFFSTVADALIRAMDFMPRNETGLIWLDPADPSTPYGFTDTVVKTGNVLFSSLLYWQACGQLAEMLNAANRPEQANDFTRRAKQIEDHLELLWDQQAGAFLAATDTGRQIDIWSNAFALYIDIPLGGRAERIRNFLCERYDDYCWQGQVRHLLGGEFWEKTWHPETGTTPEGVYQNGAYWGLPAGWVGYALARRSPSAAADHFSTLVNYYRTEGVYECVSDHGKGKMKDYVASIAAPLGAIRRLERQEPQHDT